jgi:hypothetical protein
VANDFDLANFGEIFDAMAAVICTESFCGIDCGHVERRQFERAFTRRGPFEDESFVLICVSRRFLDLVTHCVLVVLSLA